MAKKELEYYLSLPYEVTIEEDEYTTGGKCYRAFCPELPGCASHGESVEQAINALQEAKTLYIETLLTNKQRVPVPVEKTAFTSLMGNVDITSVILQKCQIRHKIEERKIQDWILTSTI